MIYFHLLIFVFGLIVGSFLNSVIYRLETGKNFVKGRSFCPYCKKQLGFWDLIPIFSFLILRGRCRICKEKISWQYPMVEITTALVFLIIFNSIKTDSILNFLGLIYYLITFCFLIIIFVYDLKHYLIPNKIVYPAIIVSFLYQIILNFKDFLSPIVSAIFASGFFLLIVLFSKGKWMGEGDIKLAFLMGLILGFPKILFALFLSFSFGAIIGVGLIILKRKKLSSEVPFGPFLVTGTFVALFWGEKIINFYLNSIL